ncbi:MAG: hypothetical protein ACJ75S_06780 [Solirubrobacterales bacterium]|jgi:hypothetical protein
MSFQKLLEDLEAISGSQNDGGETVTKSMTADGEAAGEGGDDEGGEAGGDADDAAIAAAAEDGADAGAAADDGDDEPLGKSLQIVNENGEQEEAIDATDLLKSLVERVEGNETDMTKALTMVTDLVKAQAAQIGALQGQVTKLANAGRGRRAVVSVADKPELNKALGEGGEGGDEPQGIPANEFMAKAMDACSAGKISGLDVARAESYLNRGLDVPASIKTKVLG